MPWFNYPQPEKAGEGDDDLADGLFRARIPWARRLVVCLAVRTLRRVRCWGVGSATIPSITTAGRWRDILKV